MQAFKVTKGAGSGWRLAKFATVRDAKPAEVCDLVPGDTLYIGGEGGKIIDVEGKTDAGLLKWCITYEDVAHSEAGRPIAKFEFVFKITRA